MRFANAYLLPLLLLPILLILFYTRAYLRTARDLKSFASPNSQAKIIHPDSGKLRYQKWVLRLCGLAFLILALTGPQWGYQWRESKNRGLEIILALDTSKSMLAGDVEPNRFERAKLAIKDFLNKIPGNRVGLIAFAGASFLQCPLTMDYSAFNLTLDSLSIQSIPRGGTAINTAVINARQAFKSANGSKILILITDGEDHEGDPVGQARNAAKEDIAVYTIGIGDPQGVLIEIKDQAGQSVYLKDSAGKPVKTSLNESLLKDIAAAGKGSYIRADGISLGLEKLYREKLLKYYQTALIGQKQKQYIERYQIPLILALICLLLELALGTKWSGLVKITIRSFFKQPNAINYSMDNSSSGNSSVIKETP
jgi:Ca-activated chloride channel family protein